MIRRAFYNDEGCKLRWFDDGGGWMFEVVRGLRFAQVDRVAIWTACRTLSALAATLDAIDTATSTATSVCIAILSKLAQLLSHPIELTFHAFVLFLCASWPLCHIQR